MKDGTLKVCAAMVMGTVVYSVYILANAIVGNPIPDGVLFTGMLGFIGTLSGVAIALPKIDAYRAQKGP